MTGRIPKLKRCSGLDRAALALTFAAVIVLASCDLLGGQRGWGARVSTESLRQPIQARVQNGARPDGLKEHHWQHVQRLYAASNHTPFWVGERGLHRRAAALVDALAQATTEGMQLGEYPLAALQRTLAEVGEARRPSPAQLAEADVLLTAAFAAYGEDLLTGQVAPRSVAQSWHIDPEDVNVDSALVAALRHEQFEQGLARLRPADEGYALLRRELQRYREIVAAGGWPGIPEEVALKPGDTTTTERLDLLIERLGVEGLAGEIRASSVAETTPGAATRAIYDQRIAGAVALFQERHGIDVDSILGGGTLESLNRPAEFRLRQITANLERYRWLPRILGSQHVRVNVPAFQLDVFDGGASVLSMKVVVGAEYAGRATPVFSDSIGFLVFRPYWNVPDGIAERELWPVQRRDPGYFARNNYEVVTSGGRTYVRQRPGPKNALGGVKFMFPNDFNIYLHDTPAGDLFQETVRAFSHGCIRVEKPDELAEYLLGPQGWDRERIRTAMESGPDDRRVDLQRKVPVYIVYFTAYARDGQLYFGNDLYERDDRLMLAVASGALPDADAMRAAQAVRESVRGLVRG